MLRPFASIQLPIAASTPVKRRYSVTQDIVSYRRCARQYGALHVHKYAPAHQTQLYFGTIIHQVLDRCHAHYHGAIDPKTGGTIPDDGGLLSEKDIRLHFTDIAAAEAAGRPSPPPLSEIFEYFLEVEDGLKSRGIRAITPDLRLKAIKVLQNFNMLEGETLYPRVTDTEHRLQADRTDHILHGVVDLLLDGLGIGKTAGDAEIWDYKATQRIGLNNQDLQTYLFQMQVYAHLYELKHGILPKRVVLYFMNELDLDPPPTRRPANATLILDQTSGLSAREIQDAMEAFTATVSHIESSRAADIWPAAQPGKVSEKDCAICDLRWDCPTPNSGAGVEMRYP